MPNKFEFDLEKIAAEIRDALVRNGELPAGKDWHIELIKPSIFSGKIFMRFT